MRYIFLDDAEDLRAEQAGCEMANMLRSKAQRMGVAATDGHGDGTYGTEYSCTQASL